MYAYATLVTNDDYVLGATALARSLQAVSSSAPLVVLCTRTDLDYSGLEELGCRIITVAPLELSEAFKHRHTRTAIHTAAPFTKGKKPQFHDPLDNFCKLKLWELEEYRKVVFLDADTLVIQNIEKLFGYPEFSAAPNLYETLNDMHRLNSGVFVAEPSRKTYEAMLTRLDVPDVRWRRTDQTFLETYFPDWHGLPYIYNALQYIYFNLPDLWRWNSIRVIHYQYEKPWETDHPKAAALKPLIDIWHEVLESGRIPTSLQDPVQ